MMRYCSVVVVSRLVLAGCARQPEAPAAPAAEIQGSLNQVMRGILFPNALREVSMLAYTTAQAKDMNAMLDVSDKLTVACATCHDAFRDRVVDGKTVGIEGRC